MTIDLGQIELSLHLDGILPTNAGIRVQLRSNYSNELLWENRSATATVYDEWFILDISNEDYTNLGVAGYYTLTVEYLIDEWTVLRNYLVKCTNSANSLDVPTSYVSDNESNEQTIFYEEE